MNKNIIQFIANENGQYISIPVGRVKAKSNLTTRIQLVTPITASVAVNYLIYDSKNIEKKQYLIPISELGSAVVDPNNPNYQLVAGWKVYEADIYAPILSVISKYKTGKVGMSFEFVEQVPNALCTNFVNYFGFTKELPETANNGDYYICEDYNYWLSDKLYNKGDILVYYDQEWHNGGILPKGLTETVDISVDPAISYPTEEVNETAFGNAIGKLAEDVVELYTRLKGIETTITNKQYKVDLGLNTTDKTVVGAINEVKTQEEAHYNTLNTNKLDKNFNLLVERTFAQLSDWVAVRSGSDTLKMSLETLRTHLIQGLVGLSFQIVEELPTIGTSNVIYLTPIVNSIENYETYEELPLSGIEQILYVVNDEHTGGTTGWYVWNGSNYVIYDLGFLEYIWLEEISKFELLGSTQVDLTGYATELWVTTNFVNKAVLNGGTTGQILKKNSNDDLDFVWEDDIIPNGTMFVKNPNTTELYIDIPSPNTFSMQVAVAVGSTINIDWGDGAIKTSSGGEIPHTYNKKGTYRIVISNIHKGVKINDAISKFNVLEVYGGTNYTETLAEGFKGCTNLIKAELNSVLILANQHFYSCNKLINVSLNSATSIGNFAFSRCSNLSSIILPNALTIVGGAFHFTPKLTNVYIPEVTVLQSQAFYNSGIVSIKLPKITELGFDTFKGCTNLVSLYAPNVSLFTTGADTFNGCTSLKELTLGNVTSTDKQNRFTNVVLDKLTISGNPTTADINRIVKFITDNGGAFSNGAEVFGQLKVAKSLGVGGDIGDVRLGIIGNGVISREPTSYTPTAQQKSQTISVQGNGSAYFYASDNTNGVEMSSGISSNGNGFVGTLSNDNFEFRRGNLKFAELVSTGLSMNSKKITNLQDGVTYNDAVNVGQLQTIIDTIVGV